MRMDIYLGLPRIIGQGLSARDFVPNQSLKNGGILCVFPVFQREEWGKSSAILVFHKTDKNRFMRPLLSGQRRSRLKNVVHTFLAATGGLRDKRRIKWLIPFYREIV